MTCYDPRIGKRDRGIDAGPQELIPINKPMAGGVT